MYQYDYVRVIGTGVVATKFEEHRALIDRRAGEGWRYVGWVQQRRDCTARPHI